MKNQNKSYVIFNNFSKRKKIFQILSNKSVKVNTNNSNKNFSKKFKHLLLINNP